MQLVVRAIRQEALDVKSFELAHPDGAPLPAFTAGAHVDVRIGEGMVRQYSLCNAPWETERYLIAVKREPASRGGSAALHERAREADRLEVGTPRNNFPLSARAGHHLLLAGGIGVTPLLAMALELQREGRSFGLHYFSRSVEHTAFRALVCKPEFADKVALHYALEPAAVERALRGLLAARRRDAHVYICGPRPFMALARAIAAANWPAEATHFEYFTADASGPREGFRIRLARSGVSCEVLPEQTIVEALDAHGIAVDTSCQQGVCGTCLTGLLEGEADHRDAFLSDDEKRAGDRIMLCVSRAKSGTLVLDL